MTAQLNISAIQLTVGPRTRTHPIVDVGSCPGAEPTAIGYPPPRPPADDTMRIHVRAVCILPDLDTCTQDEISDLAANCSGNTHESADDLYVLCGSGAHVREICYELGRREMEMSAKDERIALLENNVRILSQQLQKSQDFGARFAVKLDEVVRIAATERQRVAREVAANARNVELLTASTLEVARLERKLVVTQALLVTANEEITRLRGAR